MRTEVSFHRKGQLRMPRTAALRVVLRKERDFDVLFKTRVLNLFICKKEGSNELQTSRITNLFFVHVYHS